VSGAPAAFAFLFSRTVRNRLAAQAQRLRSPRYLLAVAVALGYFMFLLYRPAQDAVDGSPIMRSPTRSIGLQDLELASACGLALLAAKWWLIGGANSTLAFSAPEVQFLFPAPIPRRDLVLYKLGRMQLSLIISALVITFFVRRAGSPLPPLLRVVSLWILFCTLSLHQVAAALVRASAAQPGRGRPRHAVPLFVAGGVLLVLVAAALRAWPGARSMADMPAALDRVSHALHAPLPSALLWPFFVALHPSYAETPRTWLLALGPALVLLALHMVWVLRADSTFEDAAVQASALRADRMAAARARASGAALPTPSVVTRVSGSMAAIRGDRSPLRPMAHRSRLMLPLAPIGDPAVAVLWKNTLA
jgi:ABC-2 type transport system permease protein